MLAIRLDKELEEEIDLLAKTRGSNRSAVVREAIIQSILFLCGAVSILTTIGIVYGLTRESLDFFTQELWEDTNKQVLQPLSAVTTTFELPNTGRALETGDRIRVNEEVMDILGDEYKCVTLEEMAWAAKEYAKKYPDRINKPMGKDRQRKVGVNVDKDE